MSTATTSCDVTPAPDTSGVGAGIGLLEALLRDSVSLPSVEIAERLCALLRRGLPPWPEVTIPRADRPRATELLTDIVAEISVADLDTTARAQGLPNRLRRVLLRLRTGDAGVEYVRTGRGGVDIVADGVTVASLDELTAKVELTRFDDGVLSFDMYADATDLFGSGRVRYVLDVDGVHHEIETTGEYAKTQLFGQGFILGTHLRGTTGVAPSGGSGTITLLAVLDVQGTQCSSRVNLTYSNYSHMATGPMRYWRKDGIRFVGDRQAITYARRGTLGAIGDELALWARLVVSPRQYSRSDIVTRAAYFATRWYFKRQHIWIAHDKMYSGGDCGELMYRYLEDHKQGFTPVYAINSNAPEVPRLRAEGLRMIYPRTLKHRLVYLNAELIFTTHQNPALYNGLDGKRAVNLRDLFDARTVCIQHGLSMQGLAAIMRRSYAGIERYYCASRHEIDNLSQAEYGYSPDQLRLTGIPRFDGLVSTPKRRIMVAPTWRPEYSALPSQSGQRREATEWFLDTPFFDLYARALLDPKLLACADEAGYRIDFVLHPCIAANEPQVAAEFDRRLAELGYRDRSVVRAIAAGPEEPYERLLCDSNLMVTDYSGIQYDHAYMGKPVVYFHPDEMPPNYERGAMDYETMGFGEIAATPSELVDILCAYLRRDCAVDEVYRERISSFFAFHDRNSCERILADILADPLV